MVLGLEDLMVSHQLLSDGSRPAAEASSAYQTCFTSSTLLRWLIRGMVARA